jgi:organic hydroperoxide reductase OsmC/OhrA
MPAYNVELQWDRNGANFIDQKYQRTHSWTFENGLILQAAASPHIVGAAFTDSSVIDPEEAFTASVGSCHMLWFLSLAAGRGYVVNRYTDQTKGKLELNREGHMAMTKVILQPVVSFDPENAPGGKEFLKLHQQAHRKCFIANSVKSDIEILPKMETDQNL